MNGFIESKNYSETTCHFNRRESAEDLAFSKSATHHQLFIIF